MRNDNISLQKYQQNTKVNKKGKEGNKSYKTFQKEMNKIAKASHS